MGETENQHWIKGLKEELRKSPVISNSVFSFILMGLERLVELEFQCPCNPTWNGVFSSAFFIIPAVLAFMLMLISLRCDCCGNCKSCDCCGNCKSCDCCGNCKSCDCCGNCKSCDCCGNCKCSECCGCGECCSRFWISIVPAVMWVILVFLDGQYLACAMTDWEGRFVSMDTKNLKKWCEPVKEVKKRNNTTQEQMLKTQDFFVVSQGCGIGLLGCVCLGLVVYQSFKKD